MTMCPQYENLLWADLHGELDPSDRTTWESHLSTCLACRNAKIEGARQLALIRDAITPPPVSEKALNAAIQGIEQKLRSAENKHGKGTRRRLYPAVWIPVAASICMVVLSIGFFKSDHKATAPESVVAVSTPKSNADIQTEDMEIIRNLDLLTEFEAIEQLVHVVDHSDKTQPSPANREPFQGKRFGERKSIYG